jgi:enoyl-[acyl-carrier protein] reductase / trans-2-enoyl-CoA reductase (NAD+)
MLIQPKIRGFICTASHPEGCSESVLRQINYVKQQPQFNGPRKVLIVGASTGYGLASRIALAFGAGAQTIGVSFEKAAQGKRTASAGWYNTAAFERFSQEDNLQAKSFNGDAFSNQMKQDVVEYIRDNIGKIDCLIYSLASPRRQHPDSGDLFSSVLKPLGKSYTNKTIDPLTGVMKEVTLEPANEQEVQDTVTVMGGDDWSRWIDVLRSSDLLDEGFTTLAYSYIGPEITYPIYTNGTIGAAKKDLQVTADRLHQELSSVNGMAFISVNKALVTQSSSAIPVVPLYMSLLFKVMKANDTNEHCIEQMSRLFSQFVYSNEPGVTDSERRFRLDDWEMDVAVQKEVEALWAQVTPETIADLADLEAYQKDFYHLFGFGFDNIDYEVETDPAVSIPSLEEA